LIETQRTLTLQKKETSYWEFEAGVDAVQIFDTWAGLLPAGEFGKWCIEPTARIVGAVRQKIPGARIIGFPRGAGTELARYLEAVAVDAVGLDWTVELAFARDQVQAFRPVQGNLDPLVLQNQTAIIPAVKTFSDELAALIEKTLANGGNASSALEDQPVCYLLAAPSPA
jgi:uroporphyrinogen-III decarboxylase